MDFTLPGFLTLHSHDILLPDLEKQTKPIYDGLIEKKYPKNKIHILDDVKLAFPLFNRLAEKETYVLLENDLPDIFNEDMK